MSPTQDSGFYGCMLLVMALGIALILVFGVWPWWTQQ